MPSSACVQNVMEIGFSSVSNSCLHYSQTECTKFLGTNLKRKESKPLLSERARVCLNAIPTPCFYLLWEMFLTLTIPLTHVMLQESRSPSDLLVGMKLSHNHHLPHSYLPYKTYVGGEYFRTKHRVT